MSIVPRFLACAILLGLAGCRQQPASAPNASGTEQAEPTNAVTELPRVDPPLSRRDILLAVSEAASDVASGREPSAEGAQLNGRPFSFRIRLCERLDTGFVMSFDAETRVRKVEVGTTIDRGSPLLAPLPGVADFDEVQGFWVPRPWLLEAACPRAAEPPVIEPTDGDVPSPPQTKAKPEPEPEPEPQPEPVWSVGLAEFADKDGPRSALSRSRPFQLTERLEEGAEPGPVDLVLEGRLQRLPSGRVINCIGDGVSRVPTCIVSIQVDKVRMEDLAGKQLAQWSNF